MTVHQSGYSGQVRWDGGSSNSPAWDSVSNTSIVSWDLSYFQRMHEVKIMGSAIRSTPIVSRSIGVGDWLASIVFLLPLSFPPGADSVNVAVGLNVTVELLTTPPAGYVGEGVIERYEPSSPLDGPVTVRCVIVGTGTALAYGLDVTA